MAFVLCASGTTADNSLWTLHLSYQKASKVVSAGATTYALFEGNLLAYDAEDGSVRTFDKLSGLSDKGVVCMGWSDTQKCLVLLYENRNVDLLYEDGTVVNIPQIKNFTEYSISAHNLGVNGNWAAVATTEGVIVIDLKVAGVHGYYRLGQNVKDATVVGNVAVVALESACIMGRLSDNLYDHSQWKTACDFTATGFVPFGEGLYMTVPHVAGKTDDYAGLSYLKVADTGNAAQPVRVSSLSLSSGSASNGHLQFAGSGYLVTVDASDPLKEQYRVALAGEPTGLSYASDGTYWVASSDGALSNFRMAGNEALEDTGVKVGGFGPLHDFCYNLHYAGERLLVAGGRFDYTGRHYEPTAMAYEDGEWKFFQYEGLELADKVKYRDILSIAQDPSDPSHHYVSSAVGLLEFRDFQFVRHLNGANSAIEVAAGASGNVAYSVVDGLLYDGQGNLWMTNYEATHTLKVLKADGGWGLPDISGFTKVPTPEKTLMDKDGRIWVTSRRTVSNSTSGLLGFDYNGTIDDTSDDQALFRSRAVNGDGTECNLEYVYDICEDKDGEIWIGCGSGVYAIADPSDWFSSSFSIYQPKVPRNDGTNYADYLLTGIGVSAIAVDGGNRKWLGTLSSGIYLVSPDGTEVLAHFTAADSPLLSDNIHSLDVNPATGELMIGTAAGLCSYRTGITQPEDKLSKQRVKVYPNPVRPEYSGNVTITGLTDGAEVKVVSTGGQLVARGNAVGGTFIWDVRSGASGRRVAPGVYYLLIATSSGSESTAAKVVVI